MLDLAISEEALFALTILGFDSFVRLVWCTNRAALVLRIRLPAGLMLQLSGQVLKLSDSARQLESTLKKRGCAVLCLSSSILSCQTNAMCFLLSASGISLSRPRAVKAKANLVIITIVIMTVAGQKNHYNVKLLKGYGVSINLKTGHAQRPATISSPAKRLKNSLLRKYRMSALSLLLGRFKKSLKILLYRNAGCL